MRDEDEQPPPGKHFVSASQLKLFMFGCERRWGFQYILKIRTPSGRGAALGSLVHEQLEDYLRDGTKLDFTKKDTFGVYVAEVAAPMLCHLPEPKTPGLNVERYFKFEVPEAPDVIFRGYVDWDLHDVIGDHKTCRTFDYALKADDLRGDIQAVMYGKDFFLRHPDSDAVTLQWGYMRWGEGTPVARPVRAVLTRAQVDEVWPEIVLGANRLVATYRANKQPLELPFNSDECGKYGGCPFQGTCNLSPRERRPFRMSNATPTNNLLARIEAKKAQAAGGAEPPKMTALQAKIAAGRAAAAAQAPAPEVLSDRDVPAPTEIPAVFAGPPPMPVTDQPINCPEDYQPPPTSDAAREEQEQKALAEIAPSAEPAGKGKGGRPKGSKNATTELVTKFLTLACAWLEKNT